MWNRFLPRLVSISLSEPRAYARNPLRYANEWRTIVVPLFDREPGSNRVLWFSGPPLDLDVPERPSHSAKYLTFLAKRKFDAVNAADEANATTSAITGDPEVGYEDGGFWGKEEELKALLFGES